MVTTEDKLNSAESGATDSPPCAQSTGLAIDSDLLSACIHCGLCLPACPTYLATGRETESPRGRIYLLSQWNQGQLPLNDELYEHIDTCLGCLGCQTACPSGVKYENILNQARPFLTERRPKLVRAIMRVVFAHVLPNYWLLRLAGLFLGVWQALGIDRALSVLAEQYELNKKAEPGGDALHVVSPPKNLMIIFAQWHQFLPHIAPFKKLPPRALGDASSREPVQLFSGCIMDVFYNNVNNAALDLLVAQSRLVENPEQTCCGALAFHAGEADITKNLAKRNIELFERTNGPIVVTAAGCGAMLKEYGHLLHDEPNWAQRASSFSSRVVDITETLAAGRFTRSPKARSGAGFNADSKADSTSCSMADATALKPPVVAYHAACHLAHAQGVREAPAALLSLLATVAGGKNAAVTGRGETAGKLAAGKENQPHALREPSSAVYAPIKLIALREAEHCCGSAGIYNLMHPELALKVLDRKMDNLEKTGADIVVTTNPGCLLQLETGVRRRGLKMKVQHLCQLLHEYFV